MTSAYARLCQRNQQLQAQFNEARRRIVEFEAELLPAAENCGQVSVSQIDLDWCLPPGDWPDVDQDNE